VFVVSAIEYIHIISDHCCVDRFRLQHCGTYLEAIHACLFIQSISAETVGGASYFYWCMRGAAVPSVSFIGELLWAKAAMTLRDGRLKKSASTFGTCHASQPHTLA